MLKKWRQVSVWQNVTAALWYVFGVFAGGALIVLATDLSGIHLWGELRIVCRFVYYWSAAFLLAGSWIFRTFHLATGVDQGLFSYGLGPWLHGCVFGLVVGGPSAYAIWTCFRYDETQKRDAGESEKQKVLRAVNRTVERLGLALYFLFMSFALGFFVLAHQTFASGLVSLILEERLSTLIPKLCGLIVYIGISAVALFVATVRLNGYFLGMASTVLALLIVQSAIWWCPTWP
ncbi:hypothetical protein [Asticcacaulis benevestitus]|uniref:Uncharacterized protein n=1 Tax=Asticcacaulis benevestitus DSM 16100 = ATCC BAA-896 TaxID=1121022 RepID=V4P968_9CAUL|nr:hypothetical protein [Asticcacaulis benevestitus]ESQ90472.1 hypothetical protein ABENE_12175 [Asticcacaulis benevestitus DSM 16100 = ATCC BAA-896]